MCGKAHSSLTGGLHSEERFMRGIKHSAVAGVGWGGA